MSLRRVEMNSRLCACLSHWARWNSWNSKRNFFFAVFGVGNTKSSFISQCVARPLRKIARSLCISFSFSACVCVALALSLSHRYSAHGTWLSSSTEPIEYVERQKRISLEINKSPCIHLFVHQIRRKQKKLIEQWNSSIVSCAWIARFYFSFWVRVWVIVTFILFGKDSVCDEKLQKFSIDLSEQQLHFLPFASIIFLLVISAVEKRADDTNL